MPTLQTAETEAPSRTYFNVVDEDGNVHPAVEYWAATLGDEELSCQTLPVSRFVRLLGSKEALIDLDGTRFRGCRIGRVYVRESPALFRGKEQGATSRHGTYASSLHRARDQ